MLSVIASSLLTYSVACVATHRSDLVRLAARDSNITSDCDATCEVFAILKEQCTAPHCGCKDQFLQAQGDCLVCGADTPLDAASVQFLLDAEASQCHSEGITVNFKLQLSPAAKAIVQEVGGQSDELRRDQTTFLALQIAGGHVGLVVVGLFPLFARDVYRVPTFYNFCVSWVFSSVVYSLLLYRGIARNTLAESLSTFSWNKCIAQAALINGAQVMTASTTLALIIEIWIGLRASVYHLTLSTKTRRWTLSAGCHLLSTPYVLFLSFTLASILVGHQYTIIVGATSHRVIPANFFCMLVNSDRLLLAVYGVTLGILVVTIVFDVHIIIILYRHWRKFRRVRDKMVVSLSMLLRVMFFSMYRVLVAAAYGTVLVNPPILNDLSTTGPAAWVTYGTPVWIDMTQAAIPLVGFFIFGLNREMMSAFIFWRKAS